MESIHDVKYFSLKQLNKFIDENIDNPKVAKELMQMTLSDDPTLSMRASWALQHLSFRDPKLIHKQLPGLIKFLEKENQHTGAIRNVIRIFEEIDIPEKYISKMFDICIAYAKNTTMPHAVRVFSIYVIANICKKYPELKHELELIISELKSFPQPPSIAACIRKVNKLLWKL